MRRTNRRERQRQLWADMEFAQELQKIKAQRILIGKPVKSTSQITKEMVKCPSWKNLESELLGRKIKPKIRIDRKRLI